MQQNRNIYIYKYLKEKYFELLGKFFYSFYLSLGGLSKKWVLIY